VRTSGRPMVKISRDLGINDKTLWNWVSAAKEAEGDVESKAPKQLTMTEREELRQLRRENALLREEREILKKAAANSTGQGNSRWKTEAGERNPSVLRGRAFRRRAMPFRSACENPSRGVPLGKYCLRRRLVFSFVPRCQGL
jgi:transposase